MGVGVVGEPVLSRVGAVFELSADAQTFVSPFAREGRAKGSGCLRRGYLVPGERAGRGLADSAGFWRGTAGRIGRLSIPRYAWRGLAILRRVQQVLEVRCFRTSATAA